MIPEFPNFTPLAPKHMSLVRSITQHLPEYSDFNALSLLAWSADGDTMISNLHGNLVVLFRDYMDGSRFFSMCGSNNVHQSADALLHYSKLFRLKPELKLVPEETAILLDGNAQFDITPDRDNFDYVIDFNRLLQLEGPGYRKFRRDIAHFARGHQHNAAYIPLDLQNPIHIESMLQVFRRREDNKCDNDDRLELAAMNKLFALQHQFEVFARGITIRGELQSYVIYELANDHTIEHFCKGDVSFTGINQHLFLASCRELASMGYQYMNIEQDLGVPGLRRNKLSLDPLCFRKKYTISGKAPKQAGVQPVRQQLALKLQHS